MITLLNVDCMEYMRTVPDKYFDLAIVDPPYGIERFKKGGSHINKYGDEFGKWNNVKPSEEYFSELFRVSKNQIIWGANNFILPESEYFIVWDKQQPEEFSFAMCEQAWTNVRRPAKIISISCRNQNRIHPTQKPVRLYQWLLDNYAKPGQKILDTHLGSGSSAIAAHYFGVSEFVGCELDPDYYAAAMARFDKETAQIDMWGAQ